MSKVTKRMIFGSMGAAGLVALVAILDLAIKIPFSGQMVMDIMFLVSSALVLYMAWDTYKEMS
jgi:hypothetical protein